MHTETAIMLTIARLGVALLPSGKLSVLAGAATSITPLTDDELEVLGSPSGMAFARASRSRAQLWAVRYWLLRAADQLPWHSSCLVLAIAGRLMLLRRRVSSVVQIGVRSDHGVFMAHAWLIAGNAIVIGGEEFPQYQPLANFGRSPGSTRPGV